ncbi:MAG: AI-2E family transporter [Pirellulales bacterium]
MRQRGSHPRNRQRDRRDRRDRSTNSPLAPVSPLAPAPSTDPRRDAATVSLVVLAVIAFGTAFTLLGPVLRPFLIAVFLFYAAQFFARLLTRAGLSPTTAYASLLPVAVILTILFSQLVHREAGVFLAKWPRYEQRIMAVIDTTTATLRSWNLFERPAAEPEPDRARAPAAADDASPAASASRPGTADEPVDPTAPPAHTAATASDIAPGTDATEALLPGDRLPGDAIAAAGPTGIGPAGTGRADRDTGDLSDFFRVSSQSAVDYVFRHSLDIAELFILVLVYLVFLFLGGRKLPAKIRRAFPGEQGEQILRIGAGITESMEAFMAVKTLVGLGMGATAGLIMFALGLDHWLLWAFLFFASNYITYIGSAVTIIPPIVLAFFDFTSPWAALLLAVLLLVNRLVWIDFIEIRLSGRELNLDPVLMFLWLAYWGWVWGVLGLILAYPMMAAVKIALAHLSGGTGWAVLLSDE